MQTLPTKLFSVALTGLFGTILIFWVIVPHVVHWQINKTTPTKGYELNQFLIQFQGKRDKLMEFGLQPLMTKAEYPAKIILQLVRLEEGTEIWNAWTNIEAKIYWKVYMFNVTNHEEVAKGALPTLVELGPYVYEEKRTKVGIRVNLENDTIAYQPRVMYYFRPELSNGTEDDIITMLNVPLVAVGDELKTWSKMIRYMAKYYLSSFEEQLFIHRSVKKLLFEGEFSEMIESISNLLGRDFLPNNTFGFFSDKNGTEPYELEVFSGTQDNSKFGKTVTWKGQEKLDLWKGDSCNMINGSDNTVYPPHATKETILYGFEPDVCRSIHLEYESEEEVETIAGYRYILGDNFFNNENPNNECFCMEDDKTDCPAPGIVSVAPCKWGAPLYISHPYFLHADPKYAEEMNMTQAQDKDIHQSHVVIEPKTGVILRGHKRIQFNVMMKKSSDIPALYNVKDMMVVPLIWVDEEAYQGPTLINMVLFKMVYPLLGIEIGKWSLLVLSSMLTLTGIVVFMARTRSRKIEYY